MHNVRNNWTQLEADYETARAQFAEVWEIAEDVRAQREAIQAKRARGSWLARLLVLRR